MPLPCTHVEGRLPICIYTYRDEFTSLDLEDTAEVQEYGEAVEEDALLRKLKTFDIVMLKADKQQWSDILVRRLLVILDRL